MKDIKKEEITFVKIGKNVLIVCLFIMENMTVTPKNVDIVEKYINLNTIIVF
jgi:hypothetical protein